MEITILSGKGGTGKTTIAVGLSELFKNSIRVDCDVDAANMYLYYNGKQLKKSKFNSGKIAKINLDKCTKCNKCIDNCKFNAILDYKVNNLKCEGCGVCKLVCPSNAIDMVDNYVADIIEEKVDNGYLIRADMKIGSDGSGKLISELREKAKKYDGTILVDGSPGIGCPVISSITGSDISLIVTEPSLSGLADLKRILKLTNDFNLKKYVCINKYDINLLMTKEIQDYCKQINVDIIGLIPYDNIVIESINSLKSIVLYEESKASKEIIKMSEKLKNICKEVSYESSNSN